MYNGCPTVKWIGLFLLGLLFSFHFVPDYLALVSYGVLVSFGVLVSDDFVGVNVLIRASVTRANVRHAKWRFNLRHERGP